jgi:hypothetical protein
MKGWHYWNRRTREDLTRSSSRRRRVSADARAFEGLSSSLLMLASFGMAATRRVSRILNAHNKAVALAD